MDGEISGSKGSIRRWRPWVLGGIVVLGLGCEQREQGADKEPGAGRVTVEAPGSLAVRMAQHDAQGLAMRDAIVRGELDHVGGPAAWMAERMPDEVVPIAWRKQVGDMRDAARTVAESKNLPDAARSLAALAATCGRCHAQNSGPKIFLTEPPAETTGVVGRMERHVWATDRMWDGLIGPSDAAWRAGSEALQASPLAVENLASGGGTDAREASRLADRLRALGVEARRASNVEQRVEVYGELLSTCARCHGLLGQGSNTATEKG